MANSGHVRLDPYKILRHVSWGPSIVALVTVEITSLNDYSITPIEPSGDGNVPPLAYIPDDVDPPDFAAVWNTYYLRPYRAIETVADLLLDEQTLDPGGEVTWIVRGFSSGSYTCQEGVSPGIYPYPPVSGAGAYIGDGACEAKWNTLGTTQTFDPAVYVDGIAAPLNAAGATVRLRIEGAYEPREINHITDDVFVGSFVVETESISGPTTITIKRRSWLVPFLGQLREAALNELGAPADPGFGFSHTNTVRIDWYRGGRFTFDANHNPTNVGGTLFRSESRNFDYLASGLLIRFTDEGIV